LELLLRVATTPALDHGSFDDLHELSRSQRQCVKSARARPHERRALILDEVASALDLHVHAQL
jgi:ABC-type glutathione transport system ATPase component